MRNIPIVRLMIVCAMVFSIVSLMGPLSGNFHLPAVQLGHAVPDLCQVPTSGGCSEYWLPAGPAEDTFVATIFTDEAAEFTDIQSASPHIDFTDWPLPPDLIGPFTSSQSFRITSTISADVNFEIQFMLANNFWGINFDFGNDPNGIQIRQGVAHMIDTAKFAADDPACSSQCVALDTPNPPDNVGSLPAVNPCLWDTLFPESGPNCQIGGPPATGGTAYHLASATGANGLPYLQAPGSQDLNATATHFVTAFHGIGCTSVGFNGATSVLTNLSSCPAIAAHTVSFFIRNDNPPRLHLGDAFAAQICYIFTGSYTVPCLPYLNPIHGPITAFPGFTTSTTSINLNWGLYTAQLSSVTGVLPFDSTYYFIYNSIFASGIPSIQPPNGPCSSQAVPTVSAADYMYLCNQAYDHLTSQMEFSPCLSVPGQSPAVGETVTTYGACPGTGQESVVNATSADTTYTAQKVIFGTTPAMGATLTSSSFFWTCPPPEAFILPNKCVSGPISEQATAVFVPTGFSTTQFDETNDVVLYGSMVPNLSPLSGSTLKFVGTGTFNSGSFDAYSAGVQAADNFGAHAYTIEMFTQVSQFGYLNNGWIRVDNSVGSGLPGYWTWLNAWNPSPAVPGTIRQGYKQTTASVNPFTADTLWDRWTVGNIFDSLAVTNPLSGGQLIDWMALSIQQLPNTGLTYIPPPRTQQTFRFFLRGDMFFQDGRKVTPFDIAFSYLALKGAGAFLAQGAAPLTGVTILNDRQIDLNVNAAGLFTLLSLTTLPIIPGAYWSSAGISAYSSRISTCAGAPGSPCYPAQYTTGTPSTTTVCSIQTGFSCAFPASLMNVNVAQTGAGYDPIAAHTLVGSGPWQCGTVTSLGSGGCSTSGTMNPPVGGSITLQRFGKGIAPGSSASGVYFRSNGSLALYLWSQNNGDLFHDAENFSTVSACFGSAVTSTGPCAHFQQGIGAGTGGPLPVGPAQISIVIRFSAVNWVAPFNWAATPPFGILPLPPVLYENTITLNPASLVGCATPYPVGGYDC